MNLSMGTFAYANYPVEEVVRRISDMGYDGIELSAAGEYGRAYPSDYSPERRREVAELAREYDLAVSAYNPEIRSTTGLCLAHPQKEVRTKTVTFIKEATDMAKDLGAATLVVVPGRALFKVNMKDAWAWSLEGFRECVDHAETEGVTLGLEHLTLLEGNIVSTLPDLVRMIEEVDSKNFKAVVDTGHVNVTKESITDYVQILGTNIAHIHWDNNNGFLDAHDPPYVGSMEFSHFFRELGRIGYNGHISVEMGFVYTLDPDTPAERTKLMYDRLLEETKVPLQRS